MVIVDRYDEGQITMNRPHRMNSMGDGLPTALYDAFVQFREDPVARVAALQRPQSTRQEEVGTDSRACRGLRPPVTHVRGSGNTAAFMRGVARWRPPPRSRPR